MGEFTTHYIFNANMIHVYFTQFSHEQHRHRFNWAMPRFEHVILPTVNIMADNEHISSSFLWNHLYRRGFAEHACEQQMICNNSVIYICMESHFTTIDEEGVKTICIESLRISILLHGCKGRCQDRAHKTSAVRTSLDTSFQFSFIMSKIYFSITSLFDFIDKSL